MFFSSQELWFQSRSATAAALPLSIQLMLLQFVLLLHSCISSTASARLTHSNKHTHTHTHSSQGLPCVWLCNGHIVPDTWQSPQNILLMMSAWESSMDLKATLLKMWVQKKRQYLTTWLVRAKYRIIEIKHKVLSAISVSAHCGLGPPQL